MKQTSSNTKANITNFNFDSLKTLRDSHISFVPCYKNKKAATKWKKYIDTRPTDKDLYNWYEKNHQLYGLICGAVSNNLVCIDFDNKNENAKQHYEEFLEHSKGIFGSYEIEPFQEVSQSGGYHIWFRVESNYKTKQVGAVAKEFFGMPTIQDTKRNRIELKPIAIIEIREDNSYTIVSPSSGYKKIKGSIFNLPVISEADRNQIELLCKKFNMVLSDEENKSKFKDPNQKFNQAPEAVEEIKRYLLDNGWTLFKDDRSQKQIHLSRPGKDKDNKGSSGTIYYDKYTRFVCYSATVEEFDCKKEYNRFEVYTRLYFGNNQIKASSALREQGENIQPPLRRMTIVDMENALKDFLRVKMPHLFFDEILQVPSFMKKDSNGNIISTTPLTDGDLEVYHKRFITSVNNMYNQKAFNFAFSNYEYVSYKNLPKDYFQSLLPLWDQKSSPVEQLLSTLKFPESAYHEKLIMKYQDDNAKLREKEITRVQFSEILIIKWLLSVVAVIDNPEKNKGQLMLILIGAQGIGKSTFLNKIIPPQLKPYKKNTGILKDGKDTEIAISENIIMMVEELDGMYNTDISRLKNFITATSSKERRAYGVRAERRIRRAVFCGSTNQETLLSDLTGTRRFAIIKLENIDLKSKCLNQDHIEKVWSELYNRFNNGELFYVNQYEIATMNEYNKPYEVPSQLEENILENFQPAQFIPKTDKKKYKESTQFRLQSQQIHHALFPSDIGREISPSRFKKIGEVLRKHKFRSYRSHGKFLWFVLLVEGGSIKKNLSNYYNEDSFTENWLKIENDDILLRKE